MRTVGSECGDNVPTMHKEQRKKKKTGNKKRQDGKHNKAKGRNAAGALFSEVTPLSKVTHPTKTRRES